VASQRQPPPTLNVLPASLRRRAPYHAYRAASGLARALPEPAAAAVAAGLSRVMARALPGRRRMLARHLRRVHGPGISDGDLDREVRAAFASYARYWLESFRLRDMTVEQLDARMSWEGVEHLEAALAQGKGAIFALPHLGGWDFGGTWFAAVGYPATVVVEALDPPELFEWFAEFRRSLGLTVVPHGPASGAAVLKALRAGEMVGLVCDRDITGTGVEVEFFGERTTLPGGPATLALRTGAPLLPTTVYFSDRRMHHGVIRPALDTERRGSVREEVSRITQDLAHALEDLIAAAPDQWHLLQPNWPSDHAAV
jgi:phosphatidylinositol dimannoside acyltransferase